MYIIVKLIENYTETIIQSAVTPNVIVALSAHHALSPTLIDSDSKQSLQEEEERPWEAKAQDK